MLSVKAVGRGASARKYDLLTALGAYALARGKHDQRLVLRLITLVTARYNWARDELAVGQREIARLWSVDERTVKREMAKLRGLGWLVVKRQGARGRVTEYSLSIETLFAVTEAQWANVGPDFELRLGGAAAEAENVVALPVKGKVAAPDIEDATEWGLARTVLCQEDPALYTTWLHPLARAGRAGGRLTLKAPSRFHGTYVQTHLLARLHAVCAAVDDTVTEVIIVA